MIIWLNGTHGAGKTRTSRLLQPLVPQSRIFDAEKVGEVLMDIEPALPDTGNFQHWPPWRPLVAETARRVLDYVGGTLIIPMTVLVEPYWQEISADLSGHGIDVQHFVLHADEPTLRRRIDDDAEMGPSTFRHDHVERYLDAARSWLHGRATVIDTTTKPAAAVAAEIAGHLPYLAHGRGAR